MRCEAVWALSNCTASATPNQYEMLVKKGIIEALGSVISEIKDVRMLAVALEGIENILRVGQEHYMNECNENSFLVIMEKAGVVDDLEHLQ